MRLQALLEEGAAHEHIEARRERTLAVEDGVARELSADARGGHHRQLPVAEVGKELRRLERLGRLTDLHGDARHLCQVEP